MGVLSRLLGVSALLLWISAEQAFACGGLFCSASNPVNQAAERIVFSDNGDGTITAVIEIQYEGPAERFSWVLPVPGTPVVGLSSVAALDRLQAQTNPQYQLQNTFDDSCRQSRGGGFADGGAFLADAGAAPSLEESGVEPPVRVLASGSLGPFDYVVIEVTNPAEAPAEAALDWLEENEYDVTSLGEDLLGEYLGAGLNLIAFRLSKNADSGSIRPVTLTYEADSSIIPIRPTAVAANDDMGVLVWVLGLERAVPTNYLSLELNELLIDWFAPNATYRDVVTTAADEAGGNGFVTELADRNVDVILFNERFQWDTIRELTGPEERLNLLLDSASALGSLDGFADAVRNTVPLRAGVSVEEYVACPSCYFPTETREEVWPYPSFDGTDAGTYTTTYTHPVFPEEGTDPITTLDSEAYIAALEELVVAPMEATQELLDDADYLTRLFTTLSPDEMQVDPEFLFNPDLAPVDNVHTRERYVTCDEEGNQFWEMDFDGTTLRGEDQNWPVALGDLPANARILQLSTSGPGEVVMDQTDTIDDMVGELPPAPAGRPGPSGGGAAEARDAGRPADDGEESPAEQTDGGRPSTSNARVGSESGCGCRTVGGKPSPVGVAATLLLGMGALLRRRVDVENRRRRLLR